MAHAIDAETNTLAILALGCGTGIPEIRFWESLRLFDTRVWVS
jgi:hypothetical protein